MAHVDRKFGFNKLTIPTSIETEMVNVFILLDRVRAALLSMKNTVEDLDITEFVAPRSKYANVAANTAQWTLALAALALTEEKEHQLVAGKVDFPNSNLKVGSKVSNNSEITVTLTEDVLGMLQRKIPLVSTELELEKLKAVVMVTRSAYSSVLRISDNARLLEENDFVLIAELDAHNVLIDDDLPILISGD